MVFYRHTEEPKRGAQQEKLFHILKDDDSVEYDFQIDRKMMKKTMLSRTNIVALIEGISSNILVGSIVVLILPYIQTPPHNFSPVFTSIFLVVFGLTGGIAGQIAFAELSDKVCKDHPIRRIYFIIFSLILGTLTFVTIFFIPLPHLSVAQGKDILYMFSLPIIWLWGILFFTSNMISTLFMVSQGPILQEINLPEAQGKITSWNQLVEGIGWGIGALIVGILLVTTGRNYQLTILVLMILIIPGILLWFLALKWYPEDLKEIKQILEERAEELKSRKIKVSQA